MKAAIETLEKELNKIEMSNELEEHKKAIILIKNYIKALEWQAQ